jgi:hypothetical protein
MRLYAQLDVFDDLSEETGFDAGDEKSLAQQSGKEEADINTIVKRFGISGQLPQSVRVPLAADFVDIVSFQDAQNALLEAANSFSRMPAAIRARFDNSAAQFVDFCTEEVVDKDTGEVRLANLEDMRKFGLAVPKEPEPVVPAVPAGPVVT